MLQTIGQLGSSVAKQAKHLFPGFLQATAPRLAPRLDGGLPYLGHVLEFNKRPLDLIRRGVSEFGEIFQLQLVGTRCTVLIGPEANEAFFRAPDTQLSPREVYRFVTPVFGRGIAYDAPSNVMTEQIGFLMPALRDKNMRTYARLMQAETEAYIDNLPETGEVDFVEMCNEVTTFIASRCLLGREFRENLTTEFAHLYHDMERALNQIAFFTPYLPLPSFRKRDKARARMVELIGEVVKQRRANGTSDDDFLQALVDARYKDGRLLNSHEIAGLLLTIIFAGHHTSSVLATWTGILMMQHPRVIPNLLREQLAIHGDDGQVSFESLKTVSHLEYVIREAARMRPPLVMLMRNVLEDFHYKDFVVPAGDLLMVSPGVSHFDPAAFSDPETYDPSRFGPERQEDKKPYALITFGGGKHRCLGTHFAYMQVKALWSVFLRRLDFELLDAEYTPDYGGFVVGPHSPARVRFRKRTESMSKIVAAL